MLRINVFEGGKAINRQSHYFFRNVLSREN